MSDLRKVLKEKRLYCDGGFGSLLQNMGLQAGQAPESLNLTRPEIVTAAHKAYFEAGADLFTTNTFGVNSDKYPDTYKEMISAAVRCVRNVIGTRTDKYIALDIGPSGRLLEPLGDLAFEDAVRLFSDTVRAGVEAGVDLILIETMNDSYETKAAVLAAKENSDLPVFVTNAYDKGGKLMTGASPEAMIALLEGLGVDALGMNCSFGPDVMLEIADRFTENASVPLIVNPNAGLPRVENGQTVYDIDKDTFADYMARLAEKGFGILGGCCGTTPDYIAETVKRTQNIPYAPPCAKNKTLVSSYTHAVAVDKQPILIGERINPTGKPKLKAALREGNMSYLLDEALRQADAGAHILDVNVGLPDIDERAAMSEAVTSLQAVTDLPLQLDSNNASVLESAMRRYNGKPLVNSVNGEKASMDAVFPLVKKYGGTVIALTMDKKGIPETADGRVKIALRIVKYAEKYGIKPCDIIVDPLCLTVSSDSKSALVTLEAVRKLARRGLKTSLGVSNISFGLPSREKINAAFFAAALENGLNCAIMNPFSVGMTDVYHAYRALHDLDTACTDYIAYAAKTATGTESSVAANAPKAQNAAECSDSGEKPLVRAVVNGLRAEAVRLAEELVKTEPPLSLISGHIVPALNKIGKAFEEKRAYLPQLLMSAEAAAGAFEVIKQTLPKGETDTRRAVILATVKGDIHDIGKNIVKVLLESYGFTVYDLGKDVEPQAVLEAVRKTGCKLVGLSALMTTTVPAMEQTIALLHEKEPDTKVVVGGAVLTGDYAEKIHADAYADDAMETVRYAEKYYQG